MQSPPAEWTLGILYLVTLDVLRALGEADHDTLSEVIRNGCRVHTPRPDKGVRERGELGAVTLLEACALGLFVLALLFVVGVLPRR